MYDYMNKKQVSFFGYIDNNMCSPYYKQTA